MKNLKISFDDFKSDVLDQESLNTILGGHGSANTCTAGDDGCCDQDAPIGHYWTDDRAQATHNHTGDPDEIE